MFKKRKNKIQTTRQELDIIDSNKSNITNDHDHDDNDDIIVVNKKITSKGRNPNGLSFGSGAENQSKPRVDITEFKAYGEAEIERLRNISMAPKQENSLKFLPLDPMEDDNTPVQTTRIQTNPISDDELEPEEWEIELLKRSGAWNNKEAHDRVQEIQQDVLATKTKRSSASVLATLSTQLENLRERAQGVSREKSLHESEIISIQKSILDMETQHVTSANAIQHVEKFMEFVLGLRSCLLTKQEMIYQASKALIDLYAEAFQQRHDARIQFAADVLTSIPAQSIQDEGGFPMDRIGSGTGEVDDFGRDLGYLRFQEMESRLANTLQGLGTQGVDNWEIVKSHEKFLNHNVDGFKDRQLQIRKGIEIIFEDVAAPFNDFAEILKRAETFRNLCPEINESTFVALSINHFAKPYLLHDLSKWNVWDTSDSFDVQTESDKHPWQCFPSQFHVLSSLHRHNRDNFLFVLKEVFTPYLEIVVRSSFDPCVPLQSRKLYYLVQYLIHVGIEVSSITRLLENRMLGICKELIFPLFQDNQDTCRTLAIHQTLLGIGFVQSTHILQPFLPSASHIISSITRRLDQMLGKYSDAPKNMILAMINST